MVRVQRIYKIMEILNVKALLDTFNSLLRRTMVVKMSLFSSSKNGELLMKGRNFSCFNLHAV